MKKQSKKAFAAILSAAMALSALPAAPTAVYADSDSTAKADSAETQALKKAISDVKKRINIPKTMDKFDYDTKTSYENTFFRLRWYSEEDNGSYTYTAQEIIVEYYNGFISSYTYNDHTDNSSSKRGFAKLSSEEQFKFAENHIYVLNPDLKGDLVLSRNTSDISLSGKTVSYSISRTANNIPVAEGNYGSITIDRNTGKLISFSLKWWNDAKFPSSKKILSVEEVSEIYASRKGLYAYYDLFTKYWYDEETDRYMSEDYILPVYAPEYSGENEIDAITGKYTSLYDDKKKYSYTDAYTWSNYYDYDVEYDYSISKNPIQSIDAVAQNQLIEGYHGDWEYCYNEETYEYDLKYFRYNPEYINMTYTVTYTDGTTTYENTYTVTDNSVVLTPVFTKAVPTYVITRENASTPGFYVDYRESYTFVDAEDNGVFVSNNKGKNSSGAYMDVFFTDSGTFTFTYTVSTESGWDKFNVYAKSDGVAHRKILTDISGEVTATRTINVSAGDYIYFQYNKDSGGSAGNDTVTLSNLTFVTDEFYTKSVNLILG